jgi:hypothetical protein
MTLLVHGPGVAIGSGKASTVSLLLFSNNVLVHGTHKVLIGLIRVVIGKEHPIIIATLQLRGFLELPQKGFLKIPVAGHLSEIGQHLVPPVAEVTQTLDGIFQ